MDTVFLDLRHAVRSLRKAPGFTAVAVLTLGLGIGLNTTLFTVVHGVLLNPLPYTEADRLAVIWNDLGQGAQSLPAVHPLDFRDYREKSRLFEEFAAASGANVAGLAGVLTGEGEPEQVTLSPVTSNFFSFLGVDPLLGRHFTAAEEVPQGPQVAIISHALWQRKYGGDTEIIDRVIDIDGRPFTVVGVLPESFRLLLPPEAFLIRHSEIWVPLQADYGDMPPRNYTFFSVFGRLKPDVTFPQAQAEMNAIAAQLRAEHPVHAASNLQIRAVPFKQDVVKGVRPALLALLGAVGFVLLIVCANLANLMLVRGTARRRDLVIRAALGAGKARLMRGQLAESLLLAGLGAALALLLTQIALGALEGFAPADLPRLENLRIDPLVLAFTAGIALLTALLSGLAPALQSARLHLVEALKEGSHSTSGAGQHRLRRLLVVGELGLCLVLLVGVGLTIQSFSSLTRADPGFDPQGLLTFRLQLPATTYPDATTRQTFFDLLEERLQGLPGVTAVGATSQLPLTGSGPLSPYAYDAETARNWESITADGRVVTPSYFQAMDAQLLAGRFFTSRDNTEAPRVIIIDDLLAEQVWPGRDPVGQRLQVRPNDAENRFAEVVGVVDHLRLYELSRDVRPQIYRPFAASPGRLLSFALRTTADPNQLIPPLRRLVAELDPGLPMTEVQPMSTYVRGATAQLRFSLLLMTLFAILALVLAALGIYGVIAQAVSQRKHEFAIRLALGEEPDALRRRLVGEGMRLVGVSLLFGAALALGLTRFLDSLLFEVQPTDPTTFAAVGLFLSAVALVACYLPARRATRTNPASALRTE